jgi:hypothetical protein
MQEGYSIPRSLTIRLARRARLRYRFLTMHTISSLRKTLGLSTTNQVRNRIDSIRDVLAPHLRRGPNNQLLVSDDGVSLLRQFQELYDSGLRMTEASEVLRAKSLDTSIYAPSVSSGSAPSRTVPPESQQRLVRSLQDEISFLRHRLAILEDQLSHKTAQSEEPISPPWWARLGEDVDVT